MSGDFSGREVDFAAGSIKGIRSWGIDELGRLHGVAHKEVWRPGENMSVCRKSGEPCHLNQMREYEFKLKVSYPSVPETVYSDDNKSPLPWRKKKAKATPTPPTGGGEFKPKPCGRAGCNGTTHARRHEGNFDPNCECGFWAYSDEHFAPHGDVTGVIEGYGVVTIGTRGFRAERAKIVALAKERDDGDRLRPVTWRRLQRLYPAVEFYDTVDEMVSAHEVISYEGGDPSTEDFWTRRVRTKEDVLSAAYRSLWLGSNP